MWAATGAMFPRSGGPGLVSPNLTVNSSLSLMAKCLELHRVEDYFTVIYSYYSF